MESDIEELLTPLATRPHLNLLDAGADMNIPIPLVLRKERASQVIIIVDSSSDVANGAPELEKAALWAKLRQLPFPEINSTELNIALSAWGPKVAIFPGTSIEMPTVIYLPLLPNFVFDAHFNPASEKFCSTFSFKMSTTQFDKLADLSVANLRAAWPSIVKAISAKYEQLYPRMPDALDVGLPPQTP
jgi:hypothetical protein